MLCVAIVIEPSSIPASTSGVLIVDDHPIVLYGLRLALEQDRRFLVVGEAGDAESARAMVRALQPAYVVLDLVLGGRDGIELVRDITAAAQSTRILIYSSQNEWRYARRVLASGARGFVNKSEGLDVVVGALDVLARGDTFVSDDLRRHLLDAFVQSGSRDVVAMPTLSERETQVLRLIGTGLSMGEIADVLAVSIKTVSTYRDRLKAKLGLDNARSLAIVARDHLHD